MYTNPSHDQDWHPHSILEVEAILMGSANLQKLVNKKGAVIIIGSQPFTTEFNHEQLLELMEGEVSCYGKLTPYFK